MNIALIYFTGTGSTYALSKYLAASLKKLSNDVEMAKVEDILSGKKKMDFKTFDMLGFVLPIYALGVPAHVFDLVDMLPRNKERVFIIKTGSSYSSLNKGSSERLIRALNKKWYTVFYERLVVMSSNILLDMEDELTKKLYEVSINRKVPMIARDISRGTKRRYKKNIFRSILCSIVYSYYYTHLRKKFGKSLYAKSECEHCKNTAQNCPVNNINFDSGKFSAGDKCIMCMRCVYSCPNNAIHSRGLDFLAFKSGYDYKSIIKNKSIGSKKFSVSKKMWSYISDDKK